MRTYQDYLTQIKADPLLKYKTMARYFFKNSEGKPFELTNTQADIFRAVFEPSYTRVAIKTPTQYGKTDVTSQALLAAVTTRHEKVCIIAPKEEQASIIMKSLIGHVFDNPMFLSKLELPEGESIERLRRERSKKHLTFNGTDGSPPSEVFILTANVRSLKDEGQSIMGFGASIVVVDESSLIPDKVYSKIFRMVGGHEAGKIIKLGNPFFKNHFHRSFESDRYYTIDIDWQVAVAEGRFTHDYVMEAKEEMDEEDFLILYETKFPDRSSENALVNEEWYRQAVGRNLELNINIKQVGIDIARYGADKSVYKLREGGRVVKTKTFSKMDTMELVGFLREELDKDTPDIVALDVVGIGAGVYDRLVELGYSNIVPVNAGAKPEGVAADSFINKRAEYYWNLRSWFSRGEISLENYDKEEAEELEETRYFFVSDKKKKIESKDEIKRRLGRSPDKADALMLCFAPVKLNKVDFDFA
jgi:hypothetical protein